MPEAEMKEEQSLEQTSGGASPAQSKSWLGQKMDSAKKYWNEASPAKKAVIIVGGVVVTTAVIAGVVATGGLLAGALGVGGAAAAAGTGGTVAAGTVAVESGAALAIGEAGFVAASTGTATAAASTATVAGTTATASTAGASSGLLARFGAWAMKTKVGSFIAEKGAKEAIKHGIKKTAQNPHVRKAVKNTVGKVGEDLKKIKAEDGKVTKGDLMNSMKKHGGYEALDAGRKIAKDRFESYDGLSSVESSASAAKAVKNTETLKLGA